MLFNSLYTCVWHNLRINPLPCPPPPSPSYPICNYYNLGLKNITETNINIVTISKLIKAKEIFFDHIKCKAKDIQVEQHLPSITVL